MYYKKGFSKRRRPVGKRRIKRRHGKRIKSYGSSRGGIRL